MFGFGFQVVLILGIANILVQCSALDRNTRGFCATGEPNELLKEHHRQLSTEDAHNHHDGSEDRELVAPIEIDTWFHIVSSEADKDIVTDFMINTQLSYLQNAYRDASISYNLQGVTRTINDTWARNGDDHTMKDTLRHGGYSTLNIYFQTNLQASHGAGARATDGKGDTDRGNGISSQLTSSVLGFCTLPDPSINASSTRDDYVKDGCNVLAKTMPGGPLDNYNRGGTAIHEIGHWNGLLHTFEGESCSSKNEGDFIADTPQQSTPTDGCPKKKNSCPDRPGEDLVHNFMDYSSDVCYDSFTQGQIKRMRGMWSSMRDGK